MKIGIIGGSGLDDPKFFQEVDDLDVDTPYGKPSSTLKVGKIADIEVVMLARHGRQHTLPPTKVNFRANIQALKDQGVTHILATTACGSLRQEIGRGDFVILDQFIDFTRHRPITFFDEFPAGGENAKHTSMPDPFDSHLRQLLIDTARNQDINAHEKGTVITIEGPRFSTRAESKMFRTWGADVINMSVAPEAILANEAGIPYAAVAMSTDYDCWKEDEADVSWEEILKTFHQNVEKVTKLLVETIPKISDEPIKSRIRSIKDWPKPPVIFRDISTLLEDPLGLKLCLNDFIDRYQDKSIDVVAGIDSRGFIIGGSVAKELGKGLVLIRKKGKLPPETVGETYEKEYGPDEIEIRKGAIKPGQKVLIVDDLLATGGTALAAANLVKKLGGEVVEIAFIVDLPDIGGSKKLEEAGYDIYAQTEFEGE